MTQDMTTNIRVYFNFHRRCWSIQTKTRNGNGKLGWTVDRHADKCAILFPSFKVSQAGRERVIREGRKNVHAYVTGIPTTEVGLSGEWEQVRYNPYLMDSFQYLDGTPVGNVTLARLKVHYGKGEVWVPKRR